jgi:ubiquinone/menaquinone biosynthesis C-methylase UbiE
MREVIRWNIDNDYYLTEDYKLNNKIALEVYQQGYDAISKKYTHIKAHEIEHFLKISNKVYGALKGTGIDLGGGVGSVSSVVAKSQLVETITCLEITENCVIKCHPIVISEILGSDKNKVKSVIGDFDNLEIEDNSLDFAIAWDAIHHSNDPIKTLSEIRRVLKPEGCFILIDRAHNNSTSDNEIERMLNVQYSEEFLKENYLPKGKKLTRRDNGEHEYRFFEWESFFNKSEFRLDESIVIKESHEKNNNTKNDVGIKEIFVDFELGGFERQKAVFLLRK